MNVMLPLLSVKAYMPNCLTPIRSVKQILFDLHRQLDLFRRSAMSMGQSGGGNKNCKYWDLQLVMFVLEAERCGEL